MARYQNSYTPRRNQRLTTGTFILLLLVVGVLVWWLWPGTDNTLVQDPNQPQSKAPTPIEPERPSVATIQPSATETPGDAAPTSPAAIPAPEQPESTPPAASIPDIPRLIPATQPRRPSESIAATPGTEKFNQAKVALAANSPVQARQAFSDAINLGLNAEQKQQARQELLKLADLTIFSFRTFPDDTLSEQYTIRSGDTLTAIAKKHNITDDLLASINGIVSGDLAGNITYVNQAFLDLWGGTSPDEVIGKSALTFAQSPEDAQKILKAVIEGGTWKGEIAARKKSGRLLAVQLSANMVRNADGTPVCLMASFVDITERMEIGRAHV